MRAAVLEQLIILMRQETIAHEQLLALTDAMIALSAAEIDDILIKFDGILRLMLAIKATRSSNLEVRQ